MRRRLLTKLLLIGLLPATGWAQDPADPPDSGIRERTGRRLLQLRLSVETRNPLDEPIAAALSKNDLVVRLGLDRLTPDQYELDNLCESANLRAEELARDPIVAPPAPSVVIYVDHVRLGVEGRMNTDAMLKRVIPELAADGARMRLMANFGRLHMMHDWTTDPDALLRALDKGVADARDRDANEPTLQSRIERALEQGDVPTALELSRELNLRTQAEFGGGANPFIRLINGLEEVPIPKSIIYFATYPYAQRAEVVDRAILTGVNIYAVKADGMQEAPKFFVPLWIDPGAASRSSQSTLSRRTGGKMSYGGAGKGAPRRLLDTVRSDLRCVYILSLDASTLEADLSLPLDVSLKRGVGKSIRIRTAPRLSIPSEETVREREVASAFSSPELDGMRPAALGVRPLTVSKSHVRALLQFTIDVDPLDLAFPSTWDMGLSDAQRFPGIGDRNIRVNARNAPRIIFETEAELPMEPYAVVGVAQEVTRSGALARGVATGVLSRPHKTSFGFVGPIQLLQAERGAFAGEGQFDSAVAEIGRGGVRGAGGEEAMNALRTSGWLFRPYGTIASDRATLFSGLLCGGRKFRGKITIEKKLQLYSSVEIAGPTHEWTPSRDEPCTVLESQVDAGKFEWRGKPYRAVFQIRATDSESGQTETAKTTFWVIGPSS